MQNVAEVSEFALVERNDAFNFAARTRTNLEFVEKAAQGGNPVHAATQLVNSLLGLLVFLRERNVLDRVKTLRLIDLQRKGWPVWDTSIGAPKTLGQLVRHLRNAIAHGRIYFSSDAPSLADLWFEVSDFDTKANQITWQARIGGVQLRDFVFRLIGEIDEATG